MTLRTIPRLGLFLALLAAACSDGPTDPSSPSPDFSKAQRSFSLYSLSNATGGNAVLRFTSRANGTLEAAGSFATGGTGTGAGLGNQGALALDPDGRWLFAVNPGSNDVSVFALTGSAPTLVETVASGGSMPISLTFSRGRLYVLNAGGTGNITGFQVSSLGHLSAIPGSTQPLSSSAAGPAQIGFGRNGRFLVVTEKMTNMITVYPVGPGGAAGAPQPQPSHGMTPFGFAFDRQGLLIVSEAFGGAPGQSAVSSYSLGEDGTLNLVTGSLGTTQTAACWIVLTPGGRFGYTTNTGSADVSGFSLLPTGSLTLLDTDGITGTTGTAPIDAAIGGHFLYTLNSGSTSISGFAVGEDGSLQPVGNLAGLPAGGTGLVAR
ncbi:MAG: beta-propeller fold lactonase family protein [Gemmatimonadota bacterium]